MIKRANLLSTSTFVIMRYSFLFPFLISIGILAGASCFAGTNPQNGNILKENVWANYLTQYIKTGNHDYFKNISLSLSRVHGPTLEQGTSEQCLNDLQTLILHIRNLNYSALQIIDSWGKVSSGILQGNLNQYGDFDQCLNSYLVENERKIDFKYCLYSFRFKLTNRLQHFDHMIHSHYAITNSPNDPMHRIPHFSSFHWGLCVPKTCSAKVIENKAVQLLKENVPDDLLFSISGSDKMCYHKQMQVNHKYETYAAVTFIAVIVALGVLASMNSIYQYITKYPVFSAWLQCFSLRKNMQTLLKTDLDKDEIGLLNGARVLSAMALLLSHKHMALLYNPYVNRTSMAKMISHPWTVIGRTAIIYTDGFIFISGFLTAKALIRELNQNKFINYKKLIVTRLARLAPSLLVVILVSTWILPDMNSGPLWNMVVTKHSELCKNYWWRNMLFIHNYFGFENMCLTHTHQVGIDFQLFLACLALVVFTKKNRNIGLPIMIGLALFSTGLRFIVTYLNKLSVVIYYGISVSQLFDTANLSYILPTHRITVYLMGVILSFYLENSSKTKIAQPYIFIGWLIAAVSGILAMFGPFHMSKTNYEYNAVEAAFYNAFSPILWGILFIWTIIASANNQAGWFGSIFEWKWFKVLGKISYSVYLIQFPVFFYNVGVVRNARYFTTFELFNIEEYALIGFLSLALTLIIEIPISNMNKLYWNSTKTETKTPLQNETILIKPISEESTMRKRLKQPGE